MSDTPSAQAGSVSAVLSIGPGRVEWLELRPRGEALFGRREVHGEAPADAARAAAELVAELGVAPRRCVVVLADELLSTKVVQVPALTDAERRAALRRKAANQSGAPPRDTVFGALRLGQADAPPGNPADGRLEKWLVLAQGRPFLHDLLLKLRRRGFTARRLVPARCVALGLAGGAAGAAASEARVVVALEPECAVLSLVHGDVLIHQTVLAGCLGPGSTLGATLVQELRGLDLFWRKASRGDSFTEVLVAGGEPEHTSGLAPALAMALPGTRTVLLPDPADRRPQAGRIEALAAALHTGPFTVDLSLPLPPRPAALAGLGAVFGLAGVIAGILALGTLEARRTSWQAATAEVQELTQSLPAVRRERREREQGLERVRARRERLQALDRLGLPFEAMLLDFSQALEGRASFSTLAFTQSPSGVQIDATGETHADPLLGLLALDEVRRRLETSPHFKAVQIVPPASLPERRSAREAQRRQLSFSLRAQREVTH